MIEEVGIDTSLFHKLQSQAEKNCGPAPAMPMGTVMVAATTMPSAVV